MSASGIIQERRCSNPGIVHTNDPGILSPDIRELMNTTGSESPPDVNEVAPRPHVLAPAHCYELRRVADLGLITMAESGEFGVA